MGPRRLSGRRERGGAAAISPRERALIGTISAAALLAIAPAPAQVATQRFGAAEDGRQVDLYRLVNRRGMTVELTGRGAAIVRIALPEADGHVTDMVVGPPDFAGLIASTRRYGAIVGRYAGRLRGSVEITDGISSDDLGRIPDLNIGEALQRVPDVQLNREAEGREATINLRGLPGEYARATTTLAIASRLDPRFAPLVDRLRVRSGRTVPAWIAFLPRSRQPRQPASRLRASS